MVAIASITIPSHSVLDTVLEVAMIEICRLCGVDRFETWRSGDGFRSLVSSAP